MSSTSEGTIRERSAATAAVNDLVDRLAIADLNHRFADAISRKDVTSCADLFTDDAEIHVTNWATYVGRAGILEGLAGLIDGWKGITFTNHTGIARVAGDTATGQWYIREFGIKLGEEFDISGVYHDRYVRLGESWRFRHRRYDTLHLRKAGEITVTPYPTDLEDWVG